MVSENVSSALVGCSKTDELNTSLENIE